MAIVGSIVEESGTYRAPPRGTEGTGASPKGETQAPEAPGGPQAGAPPTWGQILVKRPRKFQQGDPHLGDLLILPGSRILFL